MPRTMLVATLTLIRHLLLPPFTSAEAIAVGNQVGVSERTDKCYLKELDKGQFISRLKMKHSQRCYAKIL